MKRSNLQRISINFYFLPNSLVTVFLGPIIHELLFISLLCRVEFLVLCLCVYLDGCYRKTHFSRKSRRDEVKNKLNSNNNTARVCKAVGGRVLFKVLTSLRAKCRLYSLFMSSGRCFHCFPEHCVLYTN